MAWPDVMGGGYHFLKLEGHYKKDSLLAGYAMHIGQNGSGYLWGCIVILSFLKMVTLILI